MTALRKLEAELLARQRRERLFPPALFADTAWDLMLELYRAHLSGAVLGLDEVCALSAAPKSTAARWIAVLERQGLVSCLRDAPGADCEVVTLTTDGSRALGDYFGAA